MSAARAPSRRGSPLGWILLAALVGYAVMIHYGVGPPPNGPATRWWQPRGYLLDLINTTALGRWVDSPGAGLVCFGLPALVLAIATWAATRSAWARTIAVASALAVGLFVFYGLGGNRALIWSFFYWRGSAVMALAALSLAGALTAPGLARSWLAHGWPARLALCLPVWLLVIVAQRDFTGTNPQLGFAISPWPVVPMFAIEIADVMIAALLAVLALVVAAIALWRERRPVALGCLAIAAAALVFLRATRARPDPALLWVTIGISGVALVALRLGGRGDETPAAHSGHRARALATGALLVAIPILGGFLLTDRDYTATREGAARRIIDALSRYYERQQEYPETLDQLVASKDLDAIPKPSVGFGLLETQNQEFTYQNFGTSYLLEFSAPRWVQCAYNPPYEDEGEPAAAADQEGGDGASTSSDAESGEDADGVTKDGDGATPGIWSCPSKPPELW